MAGCGAVCAAATVATWESPARRLAAMGQGARFLEVGDGVLQRAGNDCGPAALAHCLRRSGTAAPYPDAASSIRLGPRGCGFDQLVEEAQRMGRRAVHRHIQPARADSLTAPAVLYLRRGHFVAYEGVGADGRVIVHDPAIGRISFSPEVLARLWTGDVLEISPKTLEGDG